MAKDGIEYQCVRCTKRIFQEDLSLMPEFKCPECGYRVLKKIRPPIVKHLKAR